MKRGFSLVHVLVFFGLLVGLFLYFAPIFERAKFDARRISCRSNLNEIGWSIQQYQKKHQGKMPPDASALFKTVKDQNILVCPQNRKTYYFYRPSSNPNDVICWDGAPHVHDRFLLSKAIYDRNVLLGNGTVKRTKESDFQKLGLRGIAIAAPK